MIIKRDIVMLVVSNTSARSVVAQLFKLWQTKSTFIESLNLITFLTAIGANNETDIEQSKYDMMVMLIVMVVEDGNNMKCSCNRNCDASC